MEPLINMLLLTMLSVITIGVIRLRNLFAVVILGGIYSSLMASVMIVLDAMDVAMTEAAVGTGLSTVLLLSCLSLTTIEEAKSARITPLIPLFVSMLIIVLFYATWDLAPLGIADVPIHSHVAPYYIGNTIRDTGVPNVVTSILASYRGFDTLGEVTVIFASGLAVLMLLSGTSRAVRKIPEEES